jgi:hypothetical protein
MNSEHYHRISVLRLLVTPNVPYSPIFVTLMMEAIYSSETSVHKEPRAQHPEDGVLHSHRRENLRSYTELSCLAMSIAGVTRHVRRADRYAPALALCCSGNSKKGVQVEQKDCVCVEMQHSTDLRYKTG